MEIRSPDLTFQLENNIGILTLNRPDKFNALTTEMCAAVRDFFREVSREDEVKAIILTGAGDAFCSGSDVEKRLLPRLEGDRYIPLEKTRGDLLDPVLLYLAPALHEVGKPTIAAVNGVAAGAGLSLALFCDFRIVSEKARFLASWLNVGLTPDVGATYILPRLIGVDRALKFCFEMKPLDAAAAREIGMVTEVVPHDALMARARELAGKIAAGPAVAFELTRRAMYRGLQSDLTSQLYFENYAQDICFNSQDFREGVRAFLEKRKPRFQGK
ncbi:MAG: enoyl-CoA hydratase-related protein [Chloroflexota bacterium]